MYDEKPIEFGIGIGIGIEDCCYAHQKGVRI